MIKYIKAVKEKASGKVLAASVAIAGVVAAPAAFAEGEVSLDPIGMAKQGFGTLTATFSSMSGDAWKYLVGVVVGFAVMSLFKKFVSKAQ